MYYTTLVGSLWCDRGNLGIQPPHVLPHPHSPRPPLPQFGQAGDKCVHMCVSHNDVFPYPVGSLLAASYYSFTEATNACCTYHSAGTTLSVAESPLGMITVLYPAFLQDKCCQEGNKKGLYNNHKRRDI